MKPRNTHDPYPRVQVTIDRALWALIRLEALKEGIPAYQMLDRLATIGVQTRGRKIERRTDSDRATDVIAETVTGDQVHRDGTITAARLIEVSLVEDTPENRAAGAGHVVEPGSEYRLPPGADGGAGIGIGHARPAPKPSATRKGTKPR